MEKRGDVWISAILYFGIGIVVITILLAAGLPVINKLRDKNIIIQSKQVMHTLDENIREVIREGPGSQRVVSVNIKKGSFVIDSGGENNIVWVYENSKVPISEPGIDVPEGKLNIRTEKAPVEGTYNVEISIDYSQLADIVKEGSTTITGLSDLVIRNNGQSVDNPLTADIDESLMLQVSINEAN